MVELNVIKDPQGKLKSIEIVSTYVASSNRRRVEAIRVENYDVKHFLETLDLIKKDDQVTYWLKKSNKKVS